VTKQLTSSFLVSAGFGDQLDGWTFITIHSACTAPTWCFDFVIVSLPIATRREVYGLTSGTLDKWQRCYGAREVGGLGCSQGWCLDWRMQSSSLMSEGDSASACTKRQKWFDLAGQAEESPFIAPLSIPAACTLKTRRVDQNKT